MPNAGIHSRSSRNWNSAPPVSYPSRNRLNPKLASAKSRAIQRMARWLEPGTNSSTSTPMSGVKTISDRIGRSVMRASPDHQVGDQDQDQAGGHAQPVVLHLAGLREAQQPAEPRGQPARAVDFAVDDPFVE